MSAPAGHLPDLALEAVLLGKGSAAQRRHAALCAACAARLAEMEEQGRQFAARVFPRTIDSVLERGARRRWSFAWLALAPLAAAAVLLIGIRREPSADYVGSKGPALELSAYAQGGSVADGARLPAGAGLRFSLRAARPCSAFIVSIDEAGEVSRLVPSAGDAGLPVRGTAIVEGTVMLDGKPGPERFFAVCGATDLRFESVRAAVAALGKGAPAVRAAAQLGGLPAGALQGTLLVEKQ